MDNDEYVDNEDQIEDVEQTEIEASDEQEYVVTHDDMIRSTIDDILNDKGQNAFDTFNTLMSDKVTNALADKKQEISSTLGQDYAEVQDTQTES